MSQSWFYKWLARGGGDRVGGGRGREPVPTTTVAATARQRRRAEVDLAVALMFELKRGVHGSPRLWLDVREAGFAVTERTVANSMRRQGLVARQIRRRRGLTKQDKTATPFADLINRDFTAQAPNQRWVGDMTEIPTGEGKLYLATVIDLYSRRLLGAATSQHPDAELACAAITMAVAARGGAEQIASVIFHTDRGSTYTAGRFTRLCAAVGIRQSMGRVGSCFDNAAAESFFSSLEWEVLSRNVFDTRRQAHDSVVDWAYTFYNHHRRHTAANGLPPAEFEARTQPTNRPDAA